MTRSWAAGSILFVLAVPALPAAAQEDVPRPDATHVYREIEGTALRAHVFGPSARRKGDERAAILLFHGGGWAAGSPEWTFAAARRFADHGLVAIAVQYRLSTGDVTPIEALADTCAAFRWARDHAAELGVSDRVAGYGLSAGGHLVAATVTVGCPGDTAAARASGPDALLLWSPALDVVNDQWFTRLLQGRAAAADLSPARHVGPATPPTSIVHGDRDTLTPLAGVRRYCAAVQALGPSCEMHVYPGVGHLLTRNLANQERDFDPDPEAVADGIARHLEFLRRLGLIGQR